MGPFVSTLAAWIYGNGVLPLLPLYAIERGASETTSGLFLAFAFLCLALGTFATGLLPRDFGNRKWLIVTSGLLMVGLTLVTSHITTLLPIRRSNWARLVPWRSRLFTGCHTDGPYG